MIHEKVNSKRWYDKLGIPYSNKIQSRIFLHLKFPYHISRIYSKIRINQIRMIWIWIWSWNIKPKQISSAIAVLPFSIFFCCKKTQWYNSIWIFFCYSLRCFLILYCYMKLKIKNLLLFLFMYMNLKSKLCIP